MVRNGDSMPRRPNIPMPIVTSAPMSKRTRARLAGLGTVARHGPGHMAAMGRRGAAKLDAKIARDAGIPEDDPNYAARLKAARTAYYIRMAERRWGPRR